MEKYYEVASFQSLIVRIRTREAAIREMQQEIAFNPL